MAAAASALPSRREVVIARIAPRVGAPPAGTNDATAEPPIAVSCCATPDCCSILSAWERPRRTRRATLLCANIFTRRARESGGGECSGGSRTPPCCEERALGAKMQAIALADRPRSSARHSPRCALQPMQEHAIEQQRTRTARHDGAPHAPQRAPCRGTSCSHDHLALEAGDAAHDKANHGRANASSTATPQPSCISHQRALGASPGIHRSPAALHLSPPSRRRSTRPSLRTTRGTSCSLPWPS